MIQVYKTHYNDLVALHKTGALILTSNPGTSLIFENGVCIFEGMDRGAAIDMFFVLVKARVLETSDDQLQYANFPAVDALDSETPEETRPDEFGDGWMPSEVKL